MAGLQVRMLVVLMLLAVVMLVVLMLLVVVMLVLLLLLTLPSSTDAPRGGGAKRLLVRIPCSEVLK